MDDINNSEITDNSPEIAPFPVLVLTREKLAIQAANHNWSDADIDKIYALPNNEMEGAALAIWDNGGLIDAWIDAIENYVMTTLAAQIKPDAQDN